MVVSSDCMKKATATSHGSRRRMVPVGGAVLGMSGDMVIPLYDNDPFEAPFRPYVTWSLIALNLLAFFAELASPDTEALTSTWGVTPVAITSAPVVASVHAYATLFTGMFLHGGWLHLLGNMIYLQIFGDDIEEALGRGRFLLFYLLSGLGAALVYIASNPSSATPMIGASGAIAGVLAAYLMLKPCAKVTILVFYRVIRLRAMWAIGLWAALQLLDFMFADGGDDVAYSAHFGGLLAGAFLFFILRPSHVAFFECLEGDAP
ncbi:MAG: rhomboid family intramembrane serine protease [Alphaproteobacteria bacterium]|nr:MAG: rhomboid family intramembrane serine protease [Alphaproteobacteria bacterium]